MEDIIQLIHKDYIKYVDDPVALLRWHLTTNVFYLQWINPNYLKSMLENITHHNKYLFNKTLHTNYIKNVYHMQNIYDVIILLYQTLHFISTIQWENQYYDIGYSTKEYTLKTMFNNSNIMTRKHEYVILTLDKILKQRVGWQMVIKSLHIDREFVDNRLIEASMNDRILFRIHDKYKKLSYKD